MTSMTHEPTSRIRASLSCSRARARASTFALFGLALGMLAACDPPEQDVFKSQGGISPDPTGIIAGSVLYVGPRPTCEYEGDRPTRVVGRVLLTLFLYDNPPPPEGRATTALNLYAIPGEDLFALADCRARDADVDLGEQLTRSTPLYWPQIELGRGTTEVVYQIRGFYDTDEDMLPFFSVRNLPTSGDIIGAALADPQDPSRGLLRIRLPGVERAPNGYRREGVIVALGNNVWTERPAFEASPSNRYLESDIAISVVRDNPAATVEAIWEKTCETNARGCGFTLRQLEEDAVSESFAAGGVELDFDPQKYAWIGQPVDILTVEQGAPDVARPDGAPDPHPLLGANAGVPYVTPIVIMTRTAPTADQATIETAARIPNVRLIGSPLLDATGTGPAHRVQLGELPVAVPPAAVVELDPVDTECRVPYLAAGNFLQAYEARFTTCHELPTGIYGVSTIQGAGGGEKVDEPDMDISESGVVFNDSVLPGQAWTLPNDLALEAQVGVGKTLPSQGRNQLFMVFDPDPDQTGDCTTAIDADTLTKEEVEYRGICTDGEDHRVENPEGVDGQACLPAHCCDNVKHLCGLPPCPPCDDETGNCAGVSVGGRWVLSGPTRIDRITDDGWRVPNCIPFEMPALCCN
jgi:hypothetical protein